MLILGLNWSGDHPHDASACLLADGRILAFGEEERFVRRKRAYGLAPVHAARFCLDAADASLDDLDAVAVGWDIHALLGRTRPGQPLSTEELIEQMLPGQLFPRSSPPEIVFVPHHMAHAASTFYFSGDDAAAVLVIDGQGETSSITLAHGTNTGISVLETYPIGWSLGYFYEAVCARVGLRTDEAGKLMGLAGHGEPHDYFESEFVLRDGGFEMRSMKPMPELDGAANEWEACMRDWRVRIDELVPSSLRGCSPYEYRHVAASAQNMLEHAVSGLVDGLLRRTGERHLNLAGGVAYNGTLNGHLMARRDVDRLFIQPVAGDAGVAIGAAAWTAVQAGERIKPLQGTTAWGPSFSECVILDSIRATGMTYSEPADLSRDVARRINSGEVVGWFQGRAEGGPRALGHRSLLAHPAEVQMRDYLNGVVKKRESWRPFGPSLMGDESGSLFGQVHDLPYMIVALPLNAAAKANNAAVVHKDGTTRPQTVLPQAEPDYYQLLSAVRDESGSSVVLNTSFNGPGEPIVSTPANAIDAAIRLGLPSLALGPFLVNLPASERT